MQIDVARCRQENRFERQRGALGCLCRQAHVPRRVCQRTRGVAIIVEKARWTVSSHDAVVCHCSKLLLVRSGSVAVLYTVDRAAGGGLSMRVAGGDGVLMPTHVLRACRRRTRGRYTSLMLTSPPASLPVSSRVTASGLGPLYRCCSAVVLDTTPARRNASPSARPIAAF